MRIFKFLMVSITCFCIADSYSQTPAQKLDFLQKNIRIFYIANPNQDAPDIRSIKPGYIAASDNGIIFGSSGNNGMDNSALFLMALLKKDGDSKLQEDLYNAMQLSKKTLVLHFINDAAAGIERKFLSKYNYFVIELQGRTAVWPATYTSSLSNASDIHNAVVIGEYYSRNLSNLKELFTDLIGKIATNKYGPASVKKGAGNDKVRTVTRYSLDKLTKAQEDRWWNAQINQLGVIGNDFDGKDEIGTAPAERTETLFGSNRLDFWYPNVRPSDNKKAYKQTMIGKIKGSEHYENDILFPDYDVDFYVIPNAPYKYLIDESRKPNVNYISAFGNLKSLEWPKCPPAFEEVEAEIDLRDIHNKQFPEFFNDEMSKSSSMAGFYGVWLWDKGHCEHPEIHPAEQIWWSYKTENVFTYRCNLIADYSGRYVSKDQYDANGGEYTVGRPWAEPPVSGVFAIPFAVKPDEDRTLFRIINHGQYNVNETNTIKFDPYKVHHYVLNGQKIVSVIEPEGDESLVISFEEVGISKTGDILGFVVIKSNVGKIGSNKDAGHLFFEVKKTIVPLKKTPVAPGKVKVTLESIECYGVDDNDDKEDIFGLILCKAFAYKDTVNYETEKLPFTSTMGPSKCYAGEEVLWCLQCPLWLEFTKGRKSTFGGSLIYDFPGDGYLEVTGNLDEADSNNCTDIDVLGVPQKKIIMTNELGSQPYKFSQFFASGGTRMKVNYNIVKIK